MKKLLAGLGLALILTGSGVTVANVAGATGSPPVTNTNEVPYWCPDGGVKYDLDGQGLKSFTVPAPPDGFTWTLLVLKAGSTGHGGVVDENETFPNPVVGQAIFT